VYLTNTNVKYDLIIFDKKNHAVITKQNLLAKNATDTSLVNMIRTGGAYVNVHTTQNQNGEVRGQIS
jgi:hypothetical protein